MRVLITGGGGFLGQKLARVIATEATLDNKPVEELVLLDITAPDAIEDSKIKVTCIAGDISDNKALTKLIGKRCDRIFHLAAVVSSAAEADLDLGMRVNLDGTRNVLEACRNLSSPPRVVFTSSLAAYGGDSLPDVVGDNVELNPQNSYGTQKVISELLINDFTRRGIIDGRALRLPTVVVRPGKPNAAASSFASGVIREPLQGEACVCPVPPDTRMWITSPRTVVKSFLHAQTISADQLGSNRALGLPGITVSIAEKIEAMQRVAGSAPVKLVSFKPDAAICNIISGWAHTFDPQRSTKLGFPKDDSIDTIIQSFIEDDRVVS